MLTKRETSMSILLVSLLLIELSNCHVSRWGQLEGNRMEMRLRKVLGQLVTLTSPRGRITRRAKDFEVEQLAGITKRALFSGSPQLGTRRNNGMPLGSPGAWFGQDPGALSGGTIGAGIIAGPKGIWAGVGIKPAGENMTWFEQLGQASGGNMPSMWTITWPPNSSGDPFWDPTRTPKYQETTTFSWFTQPSSTWPNWATVNPTSWVFGTTSQPQWTTSKPIWLQNSTINSNWFFTTTTKRPWFFAPKGIAGTVPPEGPEAGPDWESFTKKLPPWREPNKTSLKQVATPTSAGKL